MNEGIKAMGYGLLGRLLDYGVTRLTGRHSKPTEKRLERIDKTLESLPAESQELTTSPSTSPESQNKPPISGNPMVYTSVSTQEEIATACVPCALGHFSRSAGALNEAMRFRNEGITSNEILDRIACVLEEQNTLERFDLTSEKLQRTPEWEREIAEEALQQSRKLRHRLEGIQSIDELEQAAADTASYYKKMNRDWYRGRFRHLGKEKAEAIESRISSEDKERIKKRAEELIEEA